MGKRITIELVDLLNYEDISVSIIKDKEFGDTARVEFTSAAMSNPPEGLPPVGPESFVLDIETFQGKISLSCDFNLYGASWWSLMCHLHNQSIAYRVA